MGDHVHMLLSIPPKYSVAQVVGFLKGKSAIHLARAYQGRKKNFTGYHFWARGYWVSTEAKTRRPCASTFRTRRKKIKELINFPSMPKNKGDQVGLTI